MFDRRHFNIGAATLLGSSFLAGRVMAADLSGGLPVEREYVFGEQPAHDVRDAVNVWLEEVNGAFGMRVGIEGLAQEWDSPEIWLDIAFPDGRLLSRRGNGKLHTATGPEGKPTVRGGGPIVFRCVEPFKTWTVSYRGEAAELTAGQLIRNPVPEEKQMTNVEFDIEMTMAAPPWVPGSLVPEAGAALKGEQGDFMSPRYEQLFRATGKMRIGDRNFDVKANGLRIKRQGIRKFVGFTGHCWQSAIFPSGKAFGFNVYPPRADGQPSYNEGFIYDGKVVKPARAVEIPWLRELRESGDRVPFVLETAEGRVAIDGTTFANTRSRGSKVLPPEFPIVQQAHAMYRWDGEEAAGMIERSTLPAQMKL